MPIIKKKKKKKKKEYKCPYSKFKFKINSYEM